MTDPRSATNRRSTGSRSSRGMNPFGQYGAGAPGTSPTQPSWIGPRNAAGGPTIKGVSALDSAAIMNDYENGKGTSKLQAEQAMDRETARQAVRGMAYEKGLMQKRQEMGLAGPQAAPATPDPAAQRRANLIAGGLQPDEADKAVASEKAASAATKAVTPVAAVAVPGAVKPPAPVAAPGAPGGTIQNDNGSTGSLANFLDDAKQRQANPANIGPQGSDATNLVSATQHVNDIKAANSPDDETPRAKGGPVKAAKHKMKPTHRAMGGPVLSQNGAMVAPQANGPAVGGNTVWNTSGGAPDKTMGSFNVGPGTNKWGMRFPYNVPVLNPDAIQRRKKGGPVQGSKKMPAKPQRVYKVGEKGPELFMPNKTGSPPSVVGADGPQTGQFSQDGVVVPNHALSAMKQKFSAQKSDDDGDVADNETASGKQPALPVAKAKMKMRPQAS